MNRDYFLYPLLLIGLLCACQASAADTNDDSFSGVVVETMDARGYTYVQVDTGSEKIWAAGPAAAIKPGDKVTITKQMPMYNYRSSSLKREFDVLYFVGGFGAGGAGSAGVGQQAHAATGNQSETALALNFEKAAGGKSIAEIIQQQKQLAEQNVRVRGKVVKYNQNIMGKDWIHIRDSSGDGDLTITTQDKVTLGDVILADGKIKLNKDFGYGYAYEVMMEDAKITVEK